MLQAAQTGNEVVGVGRDRDDFYRWVVFLEPPGHAHQGAAGAKAGDEHIDVGDGLDDFRAGGLVVRAGVALVAILVHHHVVVRVLFYQVLGDFDRAVAALGTV